MKRAISLILVALMALMLVPAFCVSAAEGTAKSNAVVYLDGTAGADTNDGKTAATAVFSFAKAIELAAAYADATEVTVVITGLTTIGEMQHNVTPDCDKAIILTSYYDGVDYRANGAALTTPNFNVSVSYMNADYTFDYLNIKILNNQPIIAMQYNNLTVTENCQCIGIEGKEDVSTSYPIILLGYNCTGTKDKAVGEPTCTDDVEVTIAGGTWEYIRPGDRDGRTTFDGNLTMNIVGGLFRNGTANETSYYTNGNINTATGKGNYGENAKIVMNLKGGTFENFAVICQQTSATYSSADVTVNVYEGAKFTGFFAAIQSGNNMYMGKATLNIHGGDFTGITESRLNNIASTLDATFTINYDANNAASAAAFKALKDAAIEDSDIKYGEIKAEVVTDAPTTDAPVTEAPATEAPATEAPATDAPAVDTTVAPETPEDTPATGDASVMVVFAAAAVLCVAAVVVIKKREN